MVKIADMKEQHESAADIEEVRAAWNVHKALDANIRSGLGRFQYAGKQDLNAFIEAGDTGGAVDAEEASFTGRFKNIARDLCMMLHIDVSTHFSPCDKSSSVFCIQCVLTAC